MTLSVNTHTLIVTIVHLADVYPIGSHTRIYSYFFFPTPCYTCHIVCMYMYTCMWACVRAVYRCNVCVTWNTRHSIILHFPLFEFFLAFFLSLARNEGHTGFLRYPRNFLYLSFLTRTVNSSRAESTFVTLFDLKIEVENQYFYFSMFVRLCDMCNTTPLWKQKKDYVQKVNRKKKEKYT